MQRYVIQDGRGKVIDVQESGARDGFTMKDGKGKLVDFPAWDPSQDPALIRANEAYDLAETADGKADDAQADVDLISQDVEITPLTPAVLTGTAALSAASAPLGANYGITAASSPLVLYSYAPGSDPFSDTPIATGEFAFADEMAVTLQDLIDGINADQDFAVASLVGGFLTFTQVSDTPILMTFSSSGNPFVGCFELGFPATSVQVSDPASTSVPGRTVLMDATHVAYGSGSVAEALDALSQPDPESDIVIYEMLYNSREPYTRFPLLPAGVAEVAAGDIVVNAMPVIKSTSFPDVSAASAAGLTFTFTDDVGRKDDNSAINYTFTTTGATVSLLERIEQLNAALAAEGIALVVIAQAGSFDVLAAYGKWSGSYDDPASRARISGTLADELGLTGDLLPRRTGYMDETTFNQVRFNGGYRSWSKLSLFADGGGLYSDGRLWLPDAANQWITFGVAVARPGGAPGELDIITRNATIVGDAVTPNPLLTFADPMREYIEPRGLVYK